MSKLTQYEQIAMVFEISPKKELHLSEITEALPNVPAPSIRRAIRHDPLKRFKAIARGIYVLAAGEVKGLLIEGDGRNLSCLEDESVSVIVTDHPWSDKASLKGGNRDFAKYECFQYTQEDFNEKARVLKPGSYLVEFLPYELASNVDYLYNIKKMAEQAGFIYYAKLLGKKKKVSNTGRVKKCIDEIYIFSKGKARVLNKGCGNGKALAYSTKAMLDQIIDYPTSPENHSAEKPVEVLRYLIEMLSLEHETVVDQFAGSCNIIPAALGCNRFAIAIEKCHDTLMKAVERLKMNTLYIAEI